MSKLLNKLHVRIIISVVIGLFLASGYTSIHYPCSELPDFKVASGEDIEKCVAFEDAIMHPGDLMNNKQNSLVNFTRNFALGGLLVFTLLSAYSWSQTRKRT